MISPLSPIFKDGVFDIKPHENLKSDFNDLIVDYEPDILAVTANSLEYELFWDMMKELPPLSHKPFVFLGGCHSTVDPEGSINNPYVDAICIGEGEKPWGDFLDTFEAGEDITKIWNTPPSVTEIAAANCAPAGSGVNPPFRKRDFWL